MFWKLRILIVLKSDAQTWDMLFDKFSNNARLYKAVKYLKNHNYIVEQEDMSYALSSYAAVREYIFHTFSCIAEIIGFVGGSIAIAQLLA